MKLYAATVVPSFVLMDDNTRPHRFAIIDVFLKIGETMGMEWSVYSLDLIQLKIRKMPSAVLHVDFYHLQHSQSFKNCICWENVDYQSLGWLITSLQA